MLIFALFETLALVGGTVHTLVPGAVAEPATILIENDRIVAVGPAIEVPVDARRIDLTGLHVVPGLIDGFVNHDPDHDRLYVTSGVTLVRDVGNDLTRVLAECDRNARERSPGPWIWSCGAALEGGRPSTTASVVLDSPAAVEAQLPRLLGLDGLAYFSFQDTLPVPAWRRVLELAHAAHKQVWGPAPRGASLDDVLAAGQDGLYHLDLFLPPGARWDKVQPSELAPRVALAAARRLAVTPTLSVYARRLLEPAANAPELEVLGPFYVESWVRDFDLRAKLVDAEFRRTGLAVLEAQSKLVRALHETGCRIVPGSAAPNPWILPGESLIDELLLLRRAGVPNADVLRLATAGAAEVLGLSNRGRVAAGYVADLSVTRGDPAADLGVLRGPEWVVLRGRPLARAELDRLRTELAAAQKKLREEFQKPIPVRDPDLPPGDVVLRGAVETRGIGVRVSAERYAVVRRFDGSLAYCGRLSAPGQATTPATETTIQQVVDQGELSSFDITIQTNGRVVRVQGERTGGRFSIQRHLDGQFVDNQTANDKLAFVDAGSVTGELILGYHKNPGHMKVLFFEDYEPAKATWEMRLDTDGTTHLVRTHAGEMKVVFDEHGAIREIGRAAGNSLLVTKSLAAEAPDKRGLPMPAGKRALAGKAGDSAAEKTPPKDGPPAPKQEQRGG